jgi:hypothetical protein
MSSIDKNRDAALSATLGNLGNRQDKSGPGRDMVDDQEAGFRSQRLIHQLDDVTRIAHPFRKLKDPDFGATHPRSVLRSVEDGAVSDVRDKHFVAFAEIEASKNSVDARGGIVHKHHILTSGAQKATNRRSRIPQSGLFTLPDADTFRGHFAQQETRRLPLYFIAQPLLSFQHAFWRSANRSVIEVCNRGIEHPVIPHGVAKLSSGHAKTLADPRVTKQIQKKKRKGRTPEFHN